MQEVRKVAGLIPTDSVLEGGGFPVNRPFPTIRLSHIDPFMMIDEMGPVEWKPGEAIGAPDHPHRGFEAVTYLMKGHMIHKDSFGGSGELRDGDIQWMTTGSGLIHSEMPHPDFQKSGGITHGFQIWVNLPAKDKMIDPYYQEIRASEIPTVNSDDGLTNIRVIAGSASGVTGKVQTRIPIHLFHVTIRPGGEFSEKILDSFNAMIYLFKGSVTTSDAGTNVTSRHLIDYGMGNTIIASVSKDAKEPAEFLLLAGEPINEPVSRYGPFIMNTKEEIVQAFEDLQAGKMGQIGN